MVSIAVAAAFRDAADADVPSGSEDPRADNFWAEKVEIDLRACQSMGPAAALWLLVYALLVTGRGYDCIVKTPMDPGVGSDLKAMGLLGILEKAGVAIDGGGIVYPAAPQFVLPLTQFETLRQVDDLTIQILDTLAATRSVAANLYPQVSDVFAELAMNVIQHSECPFGGFGFIRFSESGGDRRLTFGVADGGIGIRRSLEKNPALRDQVPGDDKAIALAVRERISGTGDRTRGIGLYFVSEDMRKLGRRLVMHSGNGALDITQEKEISYWTVTPFPGTMSCAFIPV